MTATKSSDLAVLTTLNNQFIESFRLGSWEMLEPILSRGFAYLDGATGETWPRERYIDNLRSNRSPTLGIDQLTIHIDGDVAVISARTFRDHSRYSRYVDIYERRAGGWFCVQACVWPLLG